MLQYLQVIQMLFFFIQRRNNAQLDISRGDIWIFYEKLPQESQRFTDML